jgi:hypothetical protein
MNMTLFTAAAIAALIATTTSAQVTPAAGSTPPDDTPKFNIGATIFGDYTYQDSPEVRDADNNVIHPSSFNVTRAYINVTGNLNHVIAFRITPDVARETGSGSSLSGSQNFRLKYAYAQANLDDWTTRGSWVRLGVQQTALIDYTEQIYRYRFQGPILIDRLGLVPSSDAGLSGHYNFPGNYGDVHAGFYNGEGYNRSEANDEKAFQIRGTVRPFPLGGPFLKGLRLTAFLDEDHVVASAPRRRFDGQVTYEHPLVNAGFDVIRATDQANGRAPQVDSKAWGIWVTPKFGTTGFEALIRHDDYVPNDNNNAQKQKRNIVGVAYWVPNLQRGQVALLLDRDSLERTGLTPAVPRTTTYGLKMLVNF